MRKNSSCIETDQCYLCRILHFNRQNLVLTTQNLMLTTHTYQATAYGTYWKYLAEHQKIAWDGPRNVFCLILETASSGNPTPELCFLSGRLRWTLFPKSATAIHSVAVDRTPNPLIERRTNHRRPNETFVANAEVSGNVRMCRWGVAKEPTIEKGLSYLWLFAVISCRAFFIGFSEKGQYKPRNTRSIKLGICGRISSLSSKDFWLG